MSNAATEFVSVLAGASSEVLHATILVIMFIGDPATSKNGSYCIIFQFTLVKSLLELVYHDILSRKQLLWRESNVDSRLSH